MQAIYEPGGAAREYAPLALNLYRGCSHGCLYCYAAHSMYMTREVFAKPVPRAGILEALEKQLKTWIPADERTILTAFTSDPYQPLEATERLTHRALVLMSGYVKRVAVLTKAADLVLRDLDIFKANPGWSIGWTITSARLDTCREWEPGAPDGRKRWAVLKQALAQGVPAWVSVEPVIVPCEALAIVRACIEEGVPVRVGRWNHDARANAIDWTAFLCDVLKLAAQYEWMSLYVKDELAKAGPVPAKFRVRPLG